MLESNPPLPDRRAFLRGTLIAAAGWMRLNFRWRSKRNIDMSAIRLPSGNTRRESLVRWALAIAATLLFLFVAAVTWSNFANAPSLGAAEDHTRTPDTAVYAARLGDAQLQTVTGYATTADTLPAWASSADNFTGLPIVAAADPEPQAQRVAIPQPLKPQTIAPSRAP